MKKLVLFLLLASAFAQTPTHITAGNINGVVYAEQFPGADIGAKINAAYASCPVLGCHIKVSAGTYSFTTPILLSIGTITFGNPGKPAWLECDPGITTLFYTPLSGTAITLDYGGSNIIPNKSIAHPGIYGCVIRGNGGPLGSPGTAIGIADGTNLYAQNVVEGVTIQNFNVGYQFNNSGTFEDVLRNSNIGFNNTGVLITNGANNTENNRITFNNISNNNYGIQFGPVVGGGDWYIDNNSLDGNNVQALLVQSGGGVGSQFLHITLNENHIEDAGAVALDMISISCGLVDIVGDTFVIDEGGTIAELIAVNNATVNVRDVLMHANGAVTNLVKLSGGANGNFGTVAYNSGQLAGGVYSETGAGTICTYGIPAAPQMSCQNATSGLMSLGVSSGSVVNLNSGGGASQIQLTPGSLGVAIAGHLGQTITGEYAGSCAMVSASTCTITIGQAYQTGPICFVSPQNSAAAATYSTAGAYCVASSTTITVTAGASNSGAWGAVLIGNPD